jgi:hypothetical protein
MLFLLCVPSILHAQVGNQMSREEFWERYFKYYMSKKAKREKAANKFKQLQQNIAANSAAAVADMGGQQQQTAEEEDSNRELEGELASARDGA